MEVDLTQEQNQKSYRGNDTFEAAFNDVNNQKLMNSFFKNKKSYLSSDDILQIKMDAVWKCFKAHDNQFGSQFTSSLYLYLRWEFLRFMKDRKEESRQFTYFHKNNLSQYNRIVISDNEEGQPFIPNSTFYDDLEHLQFYMDKLSEWDQQLIKQRYLDGLTLYQMADIHGMRRQTIKSHINKAIGRLHKLCEHSLK